MCGCLLYGKIKGKPQTLCNREFEAFLTGTPEGTRTPNFQNRKQYIEMGESYEGEYVYTSQFVISHHFSHQSYYCNYLKVQYLHEVWLNLYVCKYWQWFVYRNDPLVLSPH